LSQAFQYTISLAAMKFGLLVASFPLVNGHGYMVHPPSRTGGSYEIAASVDPYGACDWGAFNVHIKGPITLMDPNLLTVAKSIADPTNSSANGYDTQDPWRSPGTAPVSSPCGVNIFHQEQLQLDLPPSKDQVTWVAGSTVEVASSVFVNHGGGWSYRVCPKNGEITEECFQKHYLPFVGDATAHFTDGRETSLHSKRTPDNLWSMNPMPPFLGRHGDTHFDFAKPVEMKDEKIEAWDYSIKEKVALPADLVAGEYLLQWRWDAEKEAQV